MSGPFTEDPRFSRNTEEPGDEEQGEPAIVDTGTHWVRKMAKSGSHWTSMNWGHFEPSRGRVEDAE
jgi:hypothetical protein